MFKCKSDSHIQWEIKVVIAVMIASHLLDQTGGISLPILFRSKAYIGVFPEEVVLEHLRASTYVMYPYLESHRLYRVPVP